MVPLDQYSHSSVLVIFRPLFQKPAGIETHSYAWTSG